MVNRLMKLGLTRMPVVKRLPIVKVLALAEVALLARDHARRLSPAERRRLVRLVRKRRSKLTNLERAEMTKLVAKANPRRFAGAAIDKLSPIPLPRRLLYGKS